MGSARDRSGRLRCASSIAGIFVAPFPQRCACFTAVRVARTEGVSAFAQPARERPALIRLRRRDDVEV
jgi:hypothetical protein